jgi:uncharacterized RDD family membrane protein YckC
MATSAAEQSGPRQFCSECGRPFAAEDLALFGAAAVCGDCKPGYVQRMREGVTVAGGVVYGGFWRRGAALLIDGILLSVFALPLRMGLTLFGINSGFETYRPGLFATLFGVGTLITYAVQIAYYVYFISQKGATLGKMLMGVKVVTATGGPISVGRAFARYFAQILSGLILCIGFIMAAFDDQKRALHDHICSTRVIRD